MQQCEIGEKREGMESQGFKEEQSVLLPAAHGRDVHLVVNTEVTVNLATVVSKVGTGARVRLGGNEAKTM